MSDPEHVPQNDDQLVAIMGANLTAEFTPDARATLKWEASKYPGGLARVVAGVLADPSVRNRCAVILDRIARGQHHDTTSPPVASPIRPPNVRDTLGHVGTIPPTCPTCGHVTHGYKPVIDGCRTCGRPR